MKTFLSAVFLLVFVSPGLLFAEPGEISASHEYIMGAYDTKSDAKNLAYIGAEKKLVEKIAGLIKDKAGLISDEDARSYALALADIWLVKEEIKTHGEDIVFSATLRARVDMKDISQGLAKIKADKALQEKISDRRKELEETEAKIRGVQARLKEASPEEAVVLREHKGALFSKMNEPEQGAPETTRARQGDVMSLRAGMNYDEMVKRAGEPRSREECGKLNFFNYGTVWVCFSDEIVKGYIPAKEWQGPCHEYVPYRGEIKYF
jgi:hypothetical protein